MKSTTVRIGTIAVSALLAVMTLWPVAAGAAGGARTAPACSPKERPGAVSSLRLDETKVSAYQEIQVYFSGQLPSGACPGDTVKVQIPKLLRLHSDTYTVGDPENVPLGKMVVDAEKYTATITFNDYLADHDGVRFFAHLSTSLSPAARPGASYDLVWDVGTKKLRTPLRANSCDNCDRPRTGAHAWSTLEGPTIYFALESAPTRAARETVRFTGHVAPGQKVRCRSITAHTARVGEWGQLVWTATVPARSVKCRADPARFNKGGTFISASAQSTAAGQYLVVSANSAVTDASLERYKTFGQVVQSRYKGNVVAAANRFDTGVGGSGLVPGPDDRGAPNQKGKASKSPSPTKSTGGSTPNPDKTSGEAVQNTASQAGPDRGPILLAGLVTFIAGAVIVSFGLRRRT